MTRLLSATFSYSLIINLSLQVVSAFFTKTLGYGANKVKIQSIERVQNVSMWQSYAVKRQTVLQREAKGADETSSTAQNKLAHLNPLQLLTVSGQPKVCLDNEWINLDHEAMHGVMRRGAFMI